MLSLALRPLARPFPAPGFRGLSALSRPSVSPSPVSLPSPLLLDALIDLQAKNSRRIRKANHGARPNSNEGRRRKRRGFGKWRR
mmetsp:Transcript_20808/g.41601  ORF Transcript_20808/g.41601 Transcript_20808/m.41601 type:complete len:84 (-) Transcript_20808:122-373(-)